MDLQELRTQIDEIDRSLVALFVRRMALSEQVAAFKKAHALPVLDMQREQEKLQSVAAQAPKELDSDVRSLYERIMELSRQRQLALLGRDGVV